ncbi:solute carrier family 22 member 20-like [Amblyomma americanum]
MAGDPDKTDFIQKRGLHQQQNATAVYGHGDFQRLICCFTIVALIVLQCHNHAFALVTRPVDHWCQPPSNYANLSISKWKSVGIPLDEEGHPSECLAYAKPGQQPNNTETYECDAWDYDPARAAQSARSFWDLVCHRSWLVSLGNVVYMSGALLVVPLAGYIADKLGRKTVIIAGVVVLLASTTATFLSRSYTHYLLARFVNSACANSIFVISLILLYEVAPLTYRVSYISLSCALGVYSVDVMLFILVSFPFTWSLLIFAVHESPMWLLAASRGDEAQAVMLKAADMNDMNRVEAKQAVRRISSEHSRGESSYMYATVFAAPKVEFKSRYLFLVLVASFMMVLGIYGIAWSKRMRKETTAAVVALILSAPSYVFMFVGLVSLGRLQLLLAVMCLLGCTCCLCSVAIYAKPRLVGDVLLVFAECCARVLVPSAYL